MEVILFFLSTVFFNFSTMNIYYLCNEKTSTILKLQMKSVFLAIPHTGSRHVSYNSTGRESHLHQKCPEYKSTNSINKTKFAKKNFNLCPIKANAS